MPKANRQGLRVGVP